MTKKILIEKDVFLTFKEENDGRFSFSSENEKLQRWIETRRAQRVESHKVNVVAAAARKYLETGIPEGRGRVHPADRPAQSPMTTLIEAAQNKWRGTSVTVEVLPRDDEYSLIVKVKITLPSGEVFYGQGANQKVARRAAAEEALNYIKNL
jgi:predicted CopG family antitoxin